MKEFKLAKTMLSIMGLMAFLGCSNVDNSGGNLNQPNNPNQPNQPGNGGEGNDGDGPTIDLDKIIPDYYGIDNPNYDEFVTLASLGASIIEYLNAQYADTAGTLNYQLDLLKGLCNAYNGGSNVELSTYIDNTLSEHFHIMNTSPIITIVKYFNAMKFIEEKNGAGDSVLVEMKALGINKLILLNNSNINEVFSVKQHFENAIQYVESQGYTFERIVIPNSN